MAVETDHVHVQMVIPPKYAVSTVVETLKKNTSRWLGEKFRFLHEVYWDDEGIWSPGFFVSTVGMEEEAVKKYLEMREKEDRGQAELEF